MLPGGREGCGQVVCEGWRERGTGVPRGFSFVAGRARGEGGQPASVFGGEPRQVGNASAGGAAGSVARYLVSLALHGTAVAAVPLGTLAVNVVGSFVIGLIGGLSASGHTDVGAGFRLLLTTGFCGGFTTFSTFVNEAFCTARSGEVIGAAVYVGAGVVLGLLAVAAGWQLARAVA